MPRRVISETLTDNEMCTLGTEYKMAMAKSDVITTQALQYARQRCDSGVYIYASEDAQPQTSGTQTDTEICRIQHVDVKTGSTYNSLYELDREAIPAATLHLCFRGLPDRALRQPHFVGGGGAPTSWDRRRRREQTAGGRRRRRQFSSMGNLSISQATSFKVRGSRCRPKIEVIIIDRVQSRLYCTRLEQTIE